MSQSWARVLGAALLLVPSSGWAQGVDCTRSAGSGSTETTVSLSITSPLPGQVFESDTPCPPEVVLSGEYEVTGPYRSHDFYFVIDASRSTSLHSGVDVNGDGAQGGRADSIYSAELTAAQAFVAGLDPDSARVAVITFNSSAVLRHALSDDLASVDAELERLKGLNPVGSTRFVPALGLLVDEMLLRGDPGARLQRGLFFSDGRPSETLEDVEAAADEVAREGLVLDVLGLGTRDVDLIPLGLLASSTGGTLTVLEVPGDVIAVLPGLLPTIGHELTAILEPGSQVVALSVDTALRSFSALLPSTAGSNRVDVTIVTTEGTLVELTCSVGYEVDLPSTSEPELMTDLQLRRLLPQEELELDWVAAPDIAFARVSIGSIDRLWVEMRLHHSILPGLGTCLAPADGPWIDPDDVGDGENRLYLVVGVDECGLEGGVLPGLAWDHGPYPRPVREPTAWCP